VTGVNDGQKLRVRGEGDAGIRGGEAGDLYIYVTVQKDPVFRRQGTDLYSDVGVSFVDALLGTKIKVRVPAPLPYPGDAPAIHTLRLASPGLAPRRPVSHARTYD
jgi:molecular chaperone DnaJ